MTKTTLNVNVSFSLLLYIIKRETKFSGLIQVKQRDIGLYSMHCVKANCEKGLLSEKSRKKFGTKIDYIFMSHLIDGELVTPCSTTIVARHFQSIREAVAKLESKLLDQSDVQNKSKTPISVVTQ